MEIGVVRQLTAFNLKSDLKKIYVALKMNPRVIGGGR